MLVYSDKMFASITIWISILVEGKTDPSHCCRIYGNGNPFKMLMIAVVSLHWSLCVLYFLVYFMCKNFTETSPKNDSGDSGMFVFFSSFVYITINFVVCRWIPVKGKVKLFLFNLLFFHFFFYFIFHWPGWMRVFLNQFLWFWYFCFHFNSIAVNLVGALN